MAKVTVEDRISKAHLRIMRHPSFCAWSGILFVGKWNIVEADNVIKTAAVNAAGDVYYNRSFIQSLPYNGQVDVHANFVVLHEAGHKVLCHLTRNRGVWKTNPQLANIAADHVVNNLIHEVDPDEAFAKTMYDARGKNLFFRDAKYKHWSFVEVYKDLLREEQNNKGKSGQSGPGGTLVDSHDGSGGEMTEEEVKTVEAGIESALRSGKYLASKMGGSTNRAISEMLEPKIDWRTLLSEFVQESCSGDDDATWRNPMRRFVGEDMYFPSFTSTSIGRVVGAIDVSGSVSDAEHNACVWELIGLCRMVRPSHLHLLYWSDGVTREEVYTPDQYDSIAVLTKPVGGGGTSIVPVAEHINKIADVACVVVLTDGYTSDGWGSWQHNVLWAMTTKGTVANCGKSVYLEV